MDDAYWSWGRELLLQRLETKVDGLTSSEAVERRRMEELKYPRRKSQRVWLQVLWNQLKNPLLLVLFFAAGTSAVTSQFIDAIILMTILAAAMGIGFSREYHAQTTAATLQKRISTKSRVLRDGHPLLIPVGEIVPGDIVQLSAGSLVPGDGVLLSATDFFVNEAILTGESFPTEKTADATISEKAGVGSRKT